MIKLICNDCGQEFQCNGDINEDCYSAIEIAKNGVSPLTCWCKKCSDKRWKNCFLECFDGIEEKEKVLFT